jgi:short-subunit dehydrogenase
VTRPAPWRSAWIVGASSGIGRDLALKLAAEGVRTTVTARSRAPLDEMAATNANLVAAPGDVGIPSNLSDIFKTLADTTGVPDLIVLNAALWDPMSVDDYSATRAAASMQVNYGGVCNALETIIPALKARRSGHIAIVASVAGYRGLSQALAYAPTKAALINLSEALRLELAPHNVTVSVINPGFVDTPMTRRNDFAMPFLISSQDAANRIYAGLCRGGFEIAFPWQLVAILKLARILPYSLYFPLARRALGL